MDYYKQKLYIPQVDENDKTIGKIERWEAHEKGILHRAFDVAVFYEGRIICQHRKHLVYDGVIDFTATSHPYFVETDFQDMVEGVYSTLKREWNMNKEDLLYVPKNVGHIYYKSTDGKFVEHEICHFYVSETKTLPQMNFDYSYGYSLLTVEELKSGFPLSKALAPWIKEALDRNLL